MKPINSTKGILICLMLTLFSTHLHAQIPKLISYQGILTNTGGNAVADGNYLITVKLFDAETGGAELWSEDHTVSTVNGLFSVNLGSNTALDLPFDQPYFASTSVDGQELLPRTALTASPYAFSANGTTNNPFALDNADGSEQEVVYVNTSSLVGIGTNNPSTPLHLRSTAGVKNEFFIEPGNWNFGGDQAQITLGDFNHRITSTFGEGTTFYDVDQFRFEGSSATFENRVTVLDRLGIGAGTIWKFHVNGSTSEFHAYGDFDDANGTNLVASFLAKTAPGAVARFGSEQSPTFVDIGTNGDGAFVVEHNDQEAFIITTDGNVGIGRTFPLEPASKLTVGNQNIALKFYPEQRGFSSDPDAYNLDMDGTKDLTLTDNFIVGNKMVISSGLETPGNEALFVNGDVLVNGTVSETSDRRFKQNFLPISHALSSLQQINGWYYNWRIDEFPHKEFSTKRQIGFIAQDIEKLFPEMVHTDQAGYKSVNYGKLTPVLVEAIKEQQSQIDQLKAENAALRAELKALKSDVISRLEALESKTPATPFSSKK